MGERATRPPRSGPECRGRRDDDQGRAVETDKPYNQQYVIVAEARDGKLAHYREYWNPLVSAEALS